MECFICRISGEKAELFNALDEKEGIVKLCKNCSEKEHIPIIGRPTTFQLKEAERRQTVYERMVSISGVNRERKPIFKKSPELMRREMGLKEII
ncbi:MAG: hypothetical protein AABW81_02590, partial [Nanoarchaeota archaeon]